MPVPIRVVCRQHGALIAACLALLLAGGWQAVPKWQEAEQRKVASLRQGQAQIRTHLEAMAQQCTSLLALMTAPRLPPFAQLNERAQYPTLVYESGTRYYWSDVQYLPDYQSLAGHYTYRLVSVRGGSYLAYRRAVMVEADLREVFVLLPLARRYQIQSRYTESAFNRELFPSDEILLSALPTAPGVPFYAPDGTFLFIADYAGNYDQLGRANRLIIAGWIGLALLFFGVYAWQRIRHWIRAGDYRTALLFLAVGLLGTRAIMLLFNLPFAIYPFELFNPKFYASSFATPSLGDLLLDLLTFGVFWHFLARSVPHFSGYQHHKSQIQLVVGGGLVLGAHLALLIAVSVLETLYFNAQWTLDITQSIRFTALKVTALLVFVLIASTYFFVVTDLIRALRVYLPHKRRRWLALGLGTLVYLVADRLLSWHGQFVLPVSLAFLSLSLLIDFPSYLRRLRYQTYLYLFIGALVGAMAGTYALNEHTQRETQRDKERFAAQLLIDRDVMAEFLLSELRTQIREDEFIRRRFLNPFSSRELVEQKIRRSHLSNYFDKYEIQIILFNGYGNILTDIGEEISYHRLKQIYDKPKYRTEFEDIFFYSEVERNVFKRYLAFVEVRERNEVFGYVVVDLRMKRIIPNNVYPELLVDRRFVQPTKYREYSYAVFANNDWQYSFGEFNYEQQFSAATFQNPRLVRESFVRQDYHHLVLEGQGGQFVVVSSLAYTTRNLLTNFSFLLLILMVVALLVLLGYSLSQWPRSGRLTLAAKTQIFLNIAFFLPLLSVSIITVSVMSANYREDLRQSFVRRSENAALNLTAPLEAYRNRLISLDELGRALSQIARHTEMDLNLYDTRGRLVLSSQPLIFEKELLMPYAHPVALAQLMERRDKVALLTESVGTLKYNSVYVTLRSLESGQFVGLLSIPFFESRAELEKQITDVLGTILNIFTAIFILFLVLSYLTSQLLTEPLKLITRKIQGTTLDRNEPLEWPAADEIGLLVDAYNKMLVKLEVSREALAASEKESAWREMARQVAHEIKNPLTPIKLKLQLLQRALREDRPNLRHLTGQTVSTLLQQVDTLNDIATSFSAFAKMPTPQQAPFDLTALVRQVVSLHDTDNADASLILRAPDQPAVVSGDEALMGRVLTNLLLNAVQSVPRERTPHVEVCLSVNQSRQMARLEVVDNGMGIPETIQHKVFMPNFSTKYAGSGIGLAVAKRGVEHAGGRIWFETQPEVGTRFCIELPLA